MTPELENKLYEIDPVFFGDAIKCKNGELNETHTCMYFGCECGDGWFKPLEKMTKKIAEINKIAKNYNFEFYCEQLKEKYGTLHCYWNSRAIDRNITISYHEQWETLSSIIDDIIHQAERECKCVCEICGADGGYNGKNLVETHGWISFICKKCAQESYECEQKHFAEINKKEYIPKIRNFEEGYEFLSPYHVATFDMIIDGKNYHFNSIIHAFYALKDKRYWKIYNEIASFELYDQYTIESVAHEFGIKYEDNEEDYNLLKMIIRTKFKNTWDKELKNEFLKTYNIPLEYCDIDHQTILGICNCDKCKGEGKNLYGKALMEVREEMHLETDTKE